MTTHSKQKQPLSRFVLLFLLCLVGVVGLIYGFIAVASLWGRETITVGDIERHYRIYTPASYTAEEPVPLVFVFHMLTGSGRTAQWLTHFNQIADKEGFIVVYPDGYKASWAEGSQLYAADQNQVDDVLFISALIDQLVSAFAIDPDRIYATGFSSGGFMVQRLGCELDHKFAAIATVGATLSQKIVIDCQLQTALPVLMIQGLADRGVPWDGNRDYLSVEAVVEHWVSENGCARPPLHSQVPDRGADGTQIERDAYLDCRDQSSVILYSILGGGHAWPSGNQAVQLWGLNGKISRDIDASQVIWSFFSGTR